MNEESAKSFQDSLFTALNLFNNHEWYEAHDAFEEIWNSVDGDERQVIQGILQVSVSQFHLSKGNLNGATILLGEGLGRIKTRTKIDLGIDVLYIVISLINLPNIDRRIQDQSLNQSWFWFLFYLNPLQAK